MITIPLKIKQKNITEEQRNIMNALVISLIMELAILQLNQNILRLYLWIHIAVVSMYYRCLEENQKGDKI